MPLSPKQKGFGIVGGWKFLENSIIGGLEIAGGRWSFSNNQSKGEIYSGLNLMQAYYLLFSAGRPTFCLNLNSLELSQN